MKSRHTILLVSLILLGLFARPSGVFSQTNPLDPPVGWAPWELDKAIRSGHERAAGITTPPPTPVRAMAEWEELQSLVVTWSSYTSVLTEIIRNAQQECTVIVVCSNPATVKQQLAAAQVDTNTNLIVVRGSFDSVWSRDYGPNTIYANDVDSIALVDWIYNRPRYRDDTVSNTLSSLLNIPLYSTNTPPYDLVNTGGNYMSDGLGTAFASKLVLDENGPNNKFGKSNHPEAEVDSIMQAFMGIKRYIKMETLPDDGIHHIDMHMKLLDEETLLVGEYPKGAKDYAQLEANLQYVLQNYRTSFGTRFNVIRIPMPPNANGTYPGNGTNRTYTNAVFVNKTVVIPGYEPRYDTTAVRIWQEALPGYRIVPVNCSSPIQAGGAVHCITKEIGVNDPMLIAHKKLEPVQKWSASGYGVDAIVKHRSGIKNATLYYRTDSIQAFTAIAMNLSDPQKNIWRAVVPTQKEGTIVQYYIGGASNSGKNNQRPLPAPRAYWSFRVEQTTSNQEIRPLKSIFLPIFPNPANQITCVPFETGQFAKIKLQVRDVLGNTVEELYDGELPAGEHKYFLQADKLVPGTYYVVLMVDGNPMSQKLLVR